MNLEDLEQLIRSEALHFSTLCGYEPQDIEYQAEAGLESLSAAREFFLANHPLLRSLAEKARIIQLQKKSIAAAYLPQVSLVAELHYGRPGQNFFVNRWTTYVAGGINVSLPVFNWNKGGRDRSLADIAARQLENQINTAALAAERARIIQFQKKAIAGAYLPQVNLVAELHYGRPGQNFFVNQWTTYVAGGINVSLPVFNWNKGGRDRSLADIAVRKLENQRADFIRESERNLKQLFFYSDSLQKKLALLDGLVANAAEDAGLKEKLYAESQIDHHEYLAALTSQERYLSNREELLAQIELLKVGIHTLIGKCEEER